MRIDSTQIAKKFHPLATGPAKSNFPHRDLTCRNMNSTGSRSTLFPAISAGRDRMFAATLIFASYFAVRITLATAVLLRPETKERRVTVRVIVSEQRGFCPSPSKMEAERARGQMSLR
jgi:hypothetical protein